MRSSRSDFGRLDARWRGLLVGWWTNDLGGACMEGGKALRSFFRILASRLTGFPLILGLVGAMFIVEEGGLACSYGCAASVAPYNQPRLSAQPLKSRSHHFAPRPAGPGSTAMSWMIARHFSRTAEVGWHSSRS